MDLNKIALFNKIIEISCRLENILYDSIHNPLYAKKSSTKVKVT